MVFFSIIIKIIVGKKTIVITTLIRVIRIIGVRIRMIVIILSIMIPKLDIVRNIRKIRYN